MSQKCKAIRGFNSKYNRNWNLSALKVLSSNDSLTPPQIATEIAKQEKDTRIQKIRIIHSRLMDKNKAINGLHYLQEYDYIKNENNGVLLDDSKLSITLKGIYISLLYTDSNYSNEYYFKIDEDKIEVPDIHFAVIENIMTLEQVLEYLKDIFPFLPVIHLWIQSLLNKYEKKQLDKININTIEKEFYNIANIIFKLFIHILRSNGVLSIFFMYKSLDEFKASFKKWLESFEENQIPESTIKNNFIEIPESKINQMLTQDIDEIAAINDRIVFKEQLSTNITKKRKNTPEYRKLILETLAKKGECTRTELRKSIHELASTTRSYRIVGKDGTLSFLHDNGYLIWPAYETHARRSRKPVKITSKGIYTVLYLKISKLTQMKTTINLPTYLPNLTKLPRGIGEWIDYFNFHIHLFAPLKPVLFFWVDMVEHYSLEKNLDRISNEFIEAYLTIAFRVTLEIIIQLIEEDKVLDPYEFKEFDEIIKRLHLWIKNQEEGLLDDLLEDRLAGREELTGFEKRILEKYHVVSKKIFENK